MSIQGFSFQGISPEAVTPTRVAIYSRSACATTSSVALADQERNCREHAEKQGWVVLEDFVRSDVGKSGRTLQYRNGLNELLAAAQVKPCPFDVLVVDDYSRLSRSLKDILHLAETLKSRGVKLYIVSQHLDSDDANFRMMLIGAATLDELHVHKLRQQVHRGLEGRVRQGFSAGGRCFGYRSVPVPNHHHPDHQGGAGVLGYKLEPVENEAEVIRQVFQFYADGLSSSQIAARLNHEHLPAPRRLGTGPSESTWNPRLVIRILKNEKYVGKLIWNRTIRVRDPATGKIMSRKNPPQMWLVVDVPQLRLISEQLWDKVQVRQ
jgi:site-specific DNA recombinase